MQVAELQDLLVHQEIMEQLASQDQQELTERQAQQDLQVSAQQVRRVQVAELQDLRALREMME